MLCAGMALRIQRTVEKRIERRTVKGLPAAPRVDAPPPVDKTTRTYGPRKNAGTGPTRGTGTGKGWKKPARRRRRA